MLDYPSILKELNALRQKIEVINKNTPFQEVEYLLGVNLFQYICITPPLKEFFEKTALYRLHFFERPDYSEKRSKIIALIPQINAAITNAVTQHTINLDDSTYSAKQHPFRDHPEEKISAPQFITLINNVANYPLKPIEPIVNYNLVHSYETNQAYVTLRHFKQCIYLQVHKPFKKISSFFDNIDSQLTLLLMTPTSAPHEFSDTAYYSLPPTVINLKQLIEQYKRLIDELNTFVFTTPRDLGVESFEYLLYLRYFLSDGQLRPSDEDEKFIGGKNSYGKARYHGLRVVEELQKYIKDLIYQEKIKSTMINVDKRLPLLQKMIYACWEDIRIEFINDDKIIISTRLGQKIESNYTALGFVNQNTKRPHIQWELLRNLAKYDGQLCSFHDEFKENTKSQKYELQRKLKKIFALKDMPFDDYKKQQGYYTRFSLKYNKNFQNVNTTTIKYEEEKEDTLGIAEAYNEQAYSVNVREKNNVDD
ncbi:MAG: hypothetical protein WCW27_01305 [Patescibacteria group bacterium]|jgi:hypothetical protein